MLDIKMEQNELVLRIPKGYVDNEYLQRLINLLEVEQITEKSELTEENSRMLSEELKANWWEKNKAAFLKGAK